MGAAARQQFAPLCDVLALALGQAWNAEGRLASPHALLASTSAFTWTPRLPLYVEAQGIGSCDSGRRKALPQPLMLRIRVEAVYR